MNKLLKIILIILTPILQLSFFSSFKYLSQLNLILTLAILLLFLNSKYLYHLIFIAGITLDIYSSLPFPLITSSLFATTILLNQLFQNLFTNRSMYSLALLGFIGTIGYNLIQGILTYLAYFAKLTGYSPILDKIYFRNLAWQIILNILFLAITWSLINFFKHRLQKTFILKS